jgi:ADP-dependent NAD(P)H-hydrate dehydratase / NAD(P)H-hydrate epimerase
MCVQIYYLSMDAITSARMAAIDANCEYLGIKRLQLMENAGAAIANAVKGRISSGTVVIFAGRGNNGGDAFVAARHLGGYEIMVVLLGRKEEIKTSEAQHNWKALERTSIHLIQAADASMLDPDMIKKAGVIIDGIFGTGIRGKLKEPESTAIDLINNSNAFVISVDVPSGFDPDGGKFEKAVEADLTLTFHRMKTGMVKKGAVIYTGEIQVINIGVPVEAEFFVGPGDIQPFLTRPATSHKGDAGRVLVIGGGAYSGAPALAALAALRAGADIATVAAPESVSDIIASFSPDLIVRPLSADRLVDEDIPIISELIKKHDVVVMGMGIGNEDGTLAAVRKIIPLCKKAVVDADALTPDVIRSDHGDIIVTPHAGEMKRLSGADVPEDEKEKLKLVTDFAKNHELTVLLKGRVDIISDGTEVRASRTGNAGMTVGGTGDVLAGLTGALFAKHDAFSSACAAAFVNGTAGDLAFSRFGYGLLATDVIDCIPGAMKT